MHYAETRLKIVTLTATSALIKKFTVSPAIRVHSIFMPHNIPDISYIFTIFYNKTQKGILRTNNIVSTAIRRIHNVQIFIDIFYAKFLKFYEGFFFFGKRAGVKILYLFFVFFLRKLLIFKTVLLIA